MAYVLGIDIGGTSIKAGLFDEAGTLLDIAKIKTTELVNEETYSAVCAGLDKLLGGNGAAVADVAAVGLDVPGPVDADGKVGVLPNITLDAEGLKEALREHFTGAKLAFVNDANAAAMGEVWQGGAKDVDNCVMVTLGTGVGGGVAGAWDVLGPKVSTAFRKYCFPACAAMRISAATLGNEAGMYGAAYCAMQAE